MIIQGNALSIPLADKTVQCAVTSPPYFGLRDYGTARWIGGNPECDHNPQRPDGGERADRTLPLGRGGIYREVCGKCGAVRVDDQLGLEQSPEDYVANLVEVFREVKRVLKDNGTLWLNLGDSYVSNPGDRSKVGGFQGKASPERIAAESPMSMNKRGHGCKQKDLIGIPWMVAFALRADGWYLRSDIIWSKPNPMPESVKDRPTKAHEYVFLLTKSARYYYDAEAIYEPAAYDGRKDTQFKGSEKYKDSGQTFAERGHERWPKQLYPNGNNQSLHDYKHSGYFKEDGTELFQRGADGLPARNKRSVWTINTQPFRGAHFAVMPEKLVEPCILAGSRYGDIIIDPFAGSGTVGVVAQKYGREFIGIELNPEYAKLAEKRLIDTPIGLPIFQEKR